MEKESLPGNSISSCRLHRITIGQKLSLYLHPIHLRNALINSKNSWFVDSTAAAFVLIVSSLDYCYSLFGRGQLVRGQRIDSSSMNWLMRA